MKNGVAFPKTSDGIRNMAIYTATLTREGIVFFVKQDDVGFEVTHGGF